MVGAREGLIAQLDGIKGHKLLHGFAAFSETTEETEDVFTSSVQPEIITTSN